MWRKVTDDAPVEAVCKSFGARLRFQAVWMGGGGRAILCGSQSLEWAGWGSLGIEVGAGKMAASARK